MGGMGCSGALELGGIIMMATVTVITAICVLYRKNATKKEEN